MNILYKNIRTISAEKKGSNGNRKWKKSYGDQVQEYKK